MGTLNICFDLPLYHLHLNISQEKQDGRAALRDQRHRRHLVSGVVPSDALRSVIETAEIYRQHQTSIALGFPHSLTLHHLSVLITLLP